MKDRDQVVDLAVLLELLELADDDTSFIARLIDTFVERARMLSDRCRRGLEDGDRKSVESVAHELQSSGAQLGALRLPALARVLEVDAKGGTAPLQSLGKQFLEEVDLMCDALNAQLLVIEHRSK